MIIRRKRTVLASASDSERLNERMAGWMVGRKRNKTEQQPNQESVHRASSSSWTLSPPFYLDSITFWSKRNWELWKTTTNCTTSFQLERDNLVTDPMNYVMPATRVWSLDEEFYWWKKPKTPLATKTNLKIPLPYSHSNLKSHVS